MNSAQESFTAFGVFHGSSVSAFFAAGVRSGSFGARFPTPGAPSRVFRVPFPTSGIVPRTFPEPFPVPGMAPGRFRQAFPVPGMALGTLRPPFPTLRMAPGTFREAFGTLGMASGTSRMAFQTLLPLCIPPFSAVPASRNHSLPLRAAFGITSPVFHAVQRSSPKRTETPNHALQRTGAAVTPAASAAAFPPTTQRSRQPRRSLSLGSLAVLAHLP